MTTFYAIAVTKLGTQTGAQRSLKLLYSDSAMARVLKIIVEKHHDGYVAYPLGLKGVVVGQGDTYEEALADVKSAIRFHMETFGQQALPEDWHVLEAFVAETTLAI
jgi:predicted RNase H-like HicB family nuclease